MLFERLNSTHRSASERLRLSGVEAGGEGLLLPEGRGLSSAFSDVQASWAALHRRLRVLVHHV